ncbi:MAG: glucose 1-dehydrogenase, partial [Verrucomicrobia bacterium]|nr:glucose 1-dehydrogenase [Verrucomicrobiota bacterium]
TMRLKNKVAIITGAGRGIGFAAAQAFVREGAKVVVAEINEELGRGAEAKLRAAGGEATFVRTDCSNSADVQALMARTEKLYGGLHVLYNNASVFLNKLDGPVTDLAEDTWAKVLATNLSSVFLCCKHGIPLMIRGGGGSVINTGSSASVMGIPGCDAYTATKGATVSLTRSMAVEYGPKGIRVNCICPAGIETEMVKASSLDNANFDAAYFFKRAPLGRLGTPEEIANLAVFLASDESSYLNGAIIRADGGITVAPIS